MNNLMKVTGHEGLSRDPRSSAIISTDSNKYKQARARKEAATRQQKLEQRILVLEHKLIEVTKKLDAIMENTDA